MIAEITVEGWVTLIAAIAAALVSIINAIRGKSNSDKLDIMHQESKKRDDKVETMHDQNVQLLKNITKEC